MIINETPQKIPNAVEDRLGALARLIQEEATERENAISAAITEEVRLRNGAISTAKSEAITEATMTSYGYIVAHNSNNDSHSELFAKKRNFIGGYIGLTKNGESGWWRIGGGTLTSNKDVLMSIRIVSTFGAKQNGSFYIHLRSNASKISSCALVWEHRYGWKCTDLAVVTEDFNYNIYVNYNPQAYGMIYCEANYTSCRKNDEPLNSNLFSISTDTAPLSETPSFTYVAEDETTYVNKQSTSNINELYTAGIYEIRKGSGSPSKSQYGVVMVLPYGNDNIGGGSNQYYSAQIFVPNGDEEGEGAKPNSLFYRTSLENEWNAWQEVASLNKNQNFTGTQGFNNIVVNNILAKQTTYDKNFSSKETRNPIAINSTITVSNAAGSYSDEVVRNSVLKSDNEGNLFWATSHSGNFTRNASSTGDITLKRTINNEDIIFSPNYIARNFSRVMITIKTTSAVVAAYHSMVIDIQEFTTLYDSTSKTPIQLRASSAGENARMCGYYYYNGTNAYFKITALENVEQTKVAFLN